MGLKVTWFPINKNYKPLYVKNKEFITCTEYNIIGIASQEIFKVTFKGTVLPQENGTSLVFKSYVRSHKWLS